MKKHKPEKSKSLESWIWDAACSIRGAKDAPKYKDYILPLIFTKRLCDVFDDELNRIAAEVGSRKKAFQLAKADKKLVRFYLPLVPDDPEQPVWSVIRKLADKIGEGVTTQMRAIARENPLLQGMVSRNPRLHAVFSTMELAEERRLGLKSMRNRATEAGLPLPKFSFNDPYLDLTLYRTPAAAADALPEETLDQLSKSERKGWEWISGRESITSKAYMEALDLKYRTAMNHISRFEELNLLAPKGEGRARRYLVQIP